MSRYAFRMQLKPGMEEQYRAAHDAIWPELVDLLHDAGIRDYSIFHDAHSNALFAILSVEGEDGRVELAGHPIMQHWWEVLAPLMETQANNKPCEWSLQQVFHLT